MRQAHDLARRVWPAAYTCAWNPHDFTLPQLFACLIMREMLNLSYRKADRPAYPPDRAQPTPPPRFAHVLQSDPSCLGRTTPNQFTFKIATSPFYKGCLNRA